MIVLIYVGVILFCYGFYNMLCYVFMLPTINTGRKMTEIGKSDKRTFAEIVAISISMEIVKRNDLQWKHAEVLEERLKRKNIYTEGTAFLISRAVILILIFLLVLPMFFVNRMIFLLLAAGCVLWCTAEAIKLYSKKSDIQLKEKRKWSDTMCQLLLGVFFIAQMLVIVQLLT